MNPFRSRRLMRPLIGDGAEPSSSTPLSSGTSSPSDARLYGADDNDYDYEVCAVNEELCLFSQFFRLPLAALFLTLPATAKATYIYALNLHTRLDATSFPHRRHKHQRLHHLQDRGMVRKPANGGKLTTFFGVFVPCVLSIFSVILFLRMGYILGQEGLIVTLVMLTVAYTIVVLTILSISAISTNGLVRGGGAYYMISRSLGPEFGGAIGIIFFFANIFACGLYVSA